MAKRIRLFCLIYFATWRAQWRTCFVGSVFRQNFLRFLLFRPLLVYLYIVYMCWITFGDKSCILWGAFFSFGAFALRAAPEAGGLWATQGPQKPWRIWCKILQTTKFLALHSDFPKILFFENWFLMILDFFLKTDFW